MQGEFISNQSADLFPACGRFINTAKVGTVLDSSGLALTAKADFLNETVGSQ